MSDRTVTQFGTTAHGVLTFLVIAIAAGIALFYLVPPAVLPDTAPAAEFSAARAFKHLKVIAREPHPTGSAANADVRDYLIQQLEGQGLKAHVQRTGIASLLDIYPGYSAGTVENVVARLGGTASTGAVLLMAHYDSVGTAPGATDDGSGVVTLLETLRALKSGPPLLNDVIFLFTDGEELAMVGSQGFVNEHPWAKEVSAIWNLDSGGSCGPATLEIRNGSVLRQFKNVVPRPLTASIGAELAKLAPLRGGDTLVFDRTKVPIAGASYGGCTPRYHTTKDDLENIDLRSMQHLGIYTLAVVRDWGNSNLRDIPAAPESVFFSIPGRILSYPVALVRPITFLLVMIFAFVLLLAFRRARLSFRGLGIGILLWLVSTLLCATLATLLWWTLKSLDLVNPSYSSAYNAETYAIAFVALTIAIGSALHGLCRRKINGDNLAMGGLFWYLVLAVLSGWFAPGASFLFALPLGLGLLSLAMSFRLDGSRMLTAILRLLCAVPAVFFFALLIAFMLLTMQGDPLPSIVVAVILTVILQAFLAPQLDAMTPVGDLRFSLPFALMGVGLLAWGAFHSGYDSRHPRPDSIAYWLDADTGRASWISLDGKPDSWTSQFLTGRIENDKLNIFASPHGVKVLKSEAPPLPLPPPQIALLNDASTDNERVLRLRLSSARRPETLWISVQNATLIRATIDGKRVPSKMLEPRDKLWGFHYAAPPPQGIELTISFNPSEKPQITLTDQTSGLPSMSGFHPRPRTQDLMPLNYYPTFDSTVLVSKMFAAPQPR
jgi:Zn-dependent M28 family amino/carboxypeptidase